MSSASAGQDQIERKVIIRNISPGFIEAYIEILKKRLPREGPQNEANEPILLLRSPQYIKIPNITLQQVDPIRWPNMDITNLFEPLGDDDRRKKYEQTVDDLIKKYNNNSSPSSSSSGNSSSSSGNSRSNYFVNRPSASDLSGYGVNDEPDPYANTNTSRRGMGGSKKFLRNRIRKSIKLLKNRVGIRKTIKLLRNRIKKSIRRKVKK
jgi:hypothetical protein